MNKKYAYYLLNNIIEDINDTKLDMDLKLCKRDYIK